MVSGIKVEDDKVLVAGILNDPETKLDVTCIWEIAGGTTRIDLPHNDGLSREAWTVCAGSNFIGGDHTLSGVYELVACFWKDG